MKKLRKMICLLLAATMVLAMSVVVSGAQTVDSGKSGSGTITISNAASGQTYEIYKLFDFTYNDSTGSYAYTITSDWVTFFTTGDGKDYVTVETVTVDGTTTYYVTWNTDTSTATVQKLGQLVSAYAASNNINATVTITASDSTIEVKNLELGYYLVTSSVGSLVSLDTTNRAAEVVDKNAKPTITKEVATSANGTYGSTSTADFTDTIYYKVTITGIDEINKLTLHDKLPSGFAFGSVTSVQLYSDSSDTSPATLDSTSEYAVTSSGLTDGCSFEVNFDNLLAETDASSSYVTKVTSGDAYIVVYYTATIDSSNYSKVTIGSDGNENSAWLVSYDDYTTDGNTSSVETTLTYIYDLYIYKVDDNSKALDKAEFVLYYIDGSGDKQYATVDSSGNLTGWTNTKASASTLTSGSSGTSTTGFIYINGLDVGTYYLEETAAPDGYALLGSSDNPIEVEIKADSASSYVASVTPSTEETYGTETVNAVKVVNTANSAMPVTGGIGTTIFYIVGCILAIGAAILLVTRVRMRKTAK